jgi:hypothetical protein
MILTGIVAFQILVLWTMIRRALAANVDGLRRYVGIVAPTNDRMSDRCTAAVLSLAPPPGPG